MKVGDEVAPYHSGEKAAVGRARVVKGPVVDARDASGRQVVVEVAGGAPFPQPVPLGAAQWKALRRLAVTRP